MGVALYKHGNTHVINGIECDMQVFDEYLYASNLDAGWHLTPEECYEKEEPETDEEAATETPEETETEEDEVLTLKENKYYGDLTDGEVREIAKDKGIKYWHNKNIDKLREEVDEWQPVT